MTVSRVSPECTLCFGGDVERRLLRALVPRPALGRQRPAPPPPARVPAPSPPRRVLAPQPVARAAPNPPLPGTGDRRVRRKVVQYAPGGGRSGGLPPPVLDTELTPHKIRALHVAQLRANLISRGLNHQGLKGQLCRRLLGYYSTKVQ